MTAAGLDHRCPCGKCPYNEWGFDCWMDCEAISDWVMGKYVVVPKLPVIPKKYDRYKKCCR